MRLFLQRLVKRLEIPLEMGPSQRSGFRPTLVAIVLIYIRGWSSSKSQTGGPQRDEIQIQSRRWSGIRWANHRWQVR